MSKKFLTFELDKKGETVEIHGNSEGLTSLLKGLQNLLYEGKQDHLHLMTPSWGGEELTEEKQGENNKLINGVKIFFWK